MQYSRRRDPAFCRRTRVLKLVSPAPEWQRIHPGPDKPCCKRFAKPEARWHIPYNTTFRMPPPLPIDARIATISLSEVDPVMARVIGCVGPCIAVPIQEVDIFQALLRAIIYQQLHGKAAAAIHGRVLETTGISRVDAAAVRAVSDERLRACGLSANKLLAIRDLAAKTLDGTIPDTRVAAQLPADELIRRLTAVRGIGPWTVHMLLIFHLGHPDIMPTGDFAIRKAFSLLYRRGRAVLPAAILRHAKRWEPYRSVASWYLWRSLDPALALFSDQQSVRV